MTRTIYETRSSRRVNDDPRAAPSARLLNNMTNIGLGPGSDGRCELVRNAVTLNSVMINIARIFGASLGGIIASVLGLRCAST